MNSATIITLSRNLLSYSIFCISSLQNQPNYDTYLLVGCDVSLSRQYLNTKWQKPSFKESHPCVAVSCFRRISKILEPERVLKIT